jgi:hypothetical protein
MKVWLILFFLMAGVVNAESAAAPPAPKMRPYAGIGILQLPINASDSGESIPLYEEPALSRLGELNRAKIPPFDWIFSESSEFLPLIVMARKGEWLRVSYDDAGREAWLNPPRQIVFQAWDLFFKGRISRLLPGLQKKYYQVFQQPDESPIAVLTNKQLFKVLSFENDWAMVLIDQNMLGWLRWRDEDGRLLLGIVGRQP